MLMRRYWRPLPCLLLMLCIPVLPCPAIAAGMAEIQLEGGLGVVLGAPAPEGSLGAELTHVPEADLPADTKLVQPQIEAGGRHPWQYFNRPNVPRLYRQSPVQAFVMTGDNDEVMRVIAQVARTGCGEDFDWLKDVLIKKYDVNGDPEVSPPADYERAIAIHFVDRRIYVRCGPRLVLDYMDLGLVANWTKAQKRRWTLYQRDVDRVEKRRIVLEQRRAERFADSFTLGGKYRLEGAFGVHFKRPFAPRSTQNFPVDEPFYAGLPNLPEPFDAGEIMLTLSPERHPIVIRGRFPEVEFEMLANALRAKYGTPMKASSRHIIHKVSGNHAILKKLNDDLIELAFIDTLAKETQRKRLWAQESEGL